MADLISPGVQVKEKDLTASVRSEPTSIGATAITATWGPMNEVVTVNDETQLVDIFGKPDDGNFEYWFTAANFLAYTNTLRIVRMEQTGSLNAGETAGVLIPTTTSWLTGDGTNGPFSGGLGNVGTTAARFPGKRGNSVKVSYCWDADGYNQNAVTTTAVATAAGAALVTVVAGTTVNVNDIISFGGTTGNATNVATQVAEKGQKYKVLAINTNALTIERYPASNAAGLRSALAGNVAGIEVNRFWEFYDQFDAAPATTTWLLDIQKNRVTGSGLDELHVVVVDADGLLTGTAGTILEKFESLSKLKGAVTDSGDNNYYLDALYLGSEWIYWMDFPAGATGGSGPWGAVPTVTYTCNTATTSPESATLTGGAPASSIAPTDGQRSDAFDRFEDPDTVDFNLLMTGPSTVDGATGTTLPINNIDIVEKRKDSVVFISPYKNAVVNVVNGYTQTNNVKTYFDALPSSSYAVFDSGYKKMYDKYNDTFRWVPLNADIAGSCARTDAVEDPWWSPAGLSRGQIRGSIELALNPTQGERDILYRARINPVVTFAGEGTVLWGDKTALAQNSAFSRINVRRLFITIEEAIAKAARVILFEFNDSFTREQFLGMVNPYMRDVQARRGVTDFLVVCDESNNTGQVIDNNEFRADIYVKPARSINFITLTFVATRTDVNFSEVVGRA